MKVDECRQVSRVPYWFVSVRVDRLGRVRYSWRIWFGLWYLLANLQWCAFSIVDLADLSGICSQVAYHSDWDTPACQYDICLEDEAAPRRPLESFGPCNNLAHPPKSTGRRRSANVAFATDHNFTPCFCDRSFRSYNSGMRLHAFVGMVNSQEIDASEELIEESVSNRDPLRDFAFAYARPQEFMTNLKLAPIASLDEREEILVTITVGNAVSPCDYTLLLTVTDGLVN